MHDIFFEDSFDINNCTEYKLSIQVSLDGFSFSVFRLNDNRQIVFKTNPLKISSEKLITRRFSEWVKSEKLFDQNFGEIQIVYLSDKFTLVPDFLYIDERKSQIFESVLVLDNSEIIEENYLINEKSTLLFSLPGGLKSEILKAFNKAFIIHPVKLISENIPDSEKENSLILFINTKSFYFLHFKKGRIQILNSYKTVHPSDVVYFVLTTLKQMHTNPKKTSLWLSGESILVEATKKGLENYFLNVRTGSFELFYPGGELNQNKITHS